MLTLEGHAGVNCTQLAANGTQYLTIDLSALELGGHVNATWATLPSLSEGLVSLNLSGNLLQVSSCSSILAQAM